MFNIEIRTILLLLLCTHDANNISNNENVLLDANAELCGRS